MDHESPVMKKGRELLLDVLSGRRADVVAGIPKHESPSSAFYVFLRQNRKEFFSSYVDSLREAVDAGDTTSFLGNETFQSYSHAKNGFSLEEVLQVPLVVRRSISSILDEMLEKEETDAQSSIGARIVLNDILYQAEVIRAQSFTQTRDEVIKFYHSYQEEIDRFPSNLAATLDFSTLMRSAVRKCVELVGVERCVFLTRDLATNDLHPMASNFDHESVLGGPPVKLDESLIERLVHRQEQVLIEGHSKSIPKTRAIMKAMKTKTLLMVPLMVRERNVGIIIMDNPERPQMFTPETVELAVRFARRVAAAMENARLHGSEQQKLKETMALLEVSRLVTSTLDIDVLLSRLVQITAEVCEVGKCSAYIFVPESGRFYPAATTTVFPGSDWETSAGEGIMPSDMADEVADALLNNHQIAIDDPQISPFIPDDWVDRIGVRSVVLVPIFTRERLLGIMVLFFQKDRDDIENEETNLVAAIARQAAVALENASLYEDLEMSYFSTVKALARAIEVKDPYTYGHSERVTEYAMAIAGRMGVSEIESKSIKYAAALHDIGKIGITRKILDKPGALDDEEFLYVKTHPQLGDSIIEPVSFLQEPRIIILHHHERYDGKGYPDGLKAEEIPLGARILAVADSFEAMMSDRPYRKSLPISEAIRELEINAGSQFDPVVVRAFMEVLEEGKFESVSPGEAEKPDSDQGTAATIRSSRKQAE